MLTIDHIVLSSTDLARDAAALEERLGVPLSEGGKHALFGTHNKLLRLGRDLLLRHLPRNNQNPFRSWC